MAGTNKRGVGRPVPAPEDAPEETRVGYAVYDRTLGRFISEVTADKPSDDKAKGLAGGHPYAVVAV